MPAWSSWPIRWNTRSDPERSTSIWIFGYSLRKALAIASATFTSTEVYQTTLPSFSAAATSAGVVCCARSGAAMHSAAMVTAHSCRKLLFMVPPVVRLMNLLVLVRASVREPAAALGRKAYTDARAGRDVERGGRGDQHLLPDVDDVVAVTAEISMLAHDAGQHVRTGRCLAHDLEIVHLDAHA